MSIEIKPLPKGPPDLNTIEIAVEGELAIVKLNRPEAFNAMSPEMIFELPIAFSWLADRSGARAAVVTGAGKAFCAGGDVNWFRESFTNDEIDPSTEVRRGASVLHQGISDLRRVPFPVVAAINGPAAGAGLSLALACDIRIASTNAFLACAYGRIGASPDGGMTWLLPRAVGSAKALELLLNDPNLDAESARSEGLVTEVVEADKLIERAREKAVKLGAKSPHYIRQCKALIQGSFERSLEEQLQLERIAIAEGMGTEDARNGVEAFLAGEQPEFKGR